MAKTEWGIALNTAFGTKIEERIHNVLEAGFDNVSMVWGETEEDREKFYRQAKYIKEQNVPVYSVHAPLYPTPFTDLGIGVMWESSDAAVTYRDLLCRCAREVAEHTGAPYLVVHPTFAPTMPAPTPAGAENFGIVAEYCRSVGIKMALETMEVPSHLAYLLENIPADLAGVCWDAGHNQAYTPDVNWPKQAKGRILCTHLHDNRGKTMGPIPNTRCDTHFLPFDGIRDWDAAMRDLAASGYRGPLTLEVKRGRDVCEQIPVYAEWGEARFMKEAYARAQRLSAVYEEECRRLGG